ncbi:hypothetical protein ACVW1C_008479 [Bradyrhizobium sp. USDA 4011]
MTYVDVLLHHLDGCSNGTQRHAVVQSALKVSDSVQRVQ